MGIMQKELQDDLCKAPIVVLGQSKFWTPKPLAKSPLHFLIIPTHAWTTLSPHLFKTIFPQQRRLAVRLQTRFMKTRN